MVIPMEVEAGTTVIPMGVNRTIMAIPMGEVAMVTLMEATDIPMEVERAMPKS